jgi:hypothetical protein
MSAIWRISQAKNHPEIEGGVVLSIKQPPDGYSRGVKFMHYGLSRNDAIAMAEELLNAI